MKRKVCVATGSRADYGLLKSLMLEIKDSQQLELQIIVTGMHLSPNYGSTYKEIISDGFQIDWEIDCISKSDTPSSIAESIGKSVSGFVEAFIELRPDILILLGDRFEIFAAATAALISRIPIAHLHGGETTLGAFDEALRHSITKMSHLHFVAAEDYRKRVIQLGEDPKRVFKFGSIGLDNFRNIKLFTREEIEHDLKIKLGKKNLLITFHPATLDKESPILQMRELLSALSEFPNVTKIFTLLIREFVDENENSYAFESLGRKVYLSCMSLVDGVIGNSSSGIFEAPKLKIGTVNIGTRQAGRLQASSILNCSAKKLDISNAIKRLYSEEFLSILRTSESPYDGEGACKKILEVLEKIPLDEIIPKQFFDLPFMNKIGNI
jgi:GDP/UDP-N,N'-diacetylbacillosamine 2-epimerase (hydrolysing)